MKLETERNCFTMKIDPILLSAAVAVIPIVMGIPTPVTTTPPIPSNPTRTLSIPHISWPPEPGMFSNNKIKAFWYYVSTNQGVHSS
ncbi:hypothetical protein BJ165DRAFT_1489286 [Panaeolus papilionaceus]|nr:hypothetical protein BJ165DRAFT_1489286 [Panaeolus papilionaceus]